MSDEAKKLLKNALALGESERALIATSLIESLDPEPDPRVEEEWEQEILKRVQELDSGSVKKISWAEVRRQILERTR